MTKKKEKDGGNLQHKEAFMRMNFLHQAAALLSASAGGAGQASQADAMLNLGTHYANTMKTVGKKLVIRSWAPITRGTWTVPTGLPFAEILP